MTLKSIKWWKYSGIYLLITGILHCAVSFVSFGHTYIQIFNNGFISLLISGSSVPRHRFMGSSSTECR